MLEKLGQALKKATDKIANALFLDRDLVESIIRDLQRALIEADMNIPLVKELSEKIRKAAFDERIKEIDKKEHIIKLLHDELSSILGEYKPLQIQKKQNRIMFLGLYGAGKCVHGKSNIPLSDGNIIQIEKLYNKYSEKFKEEELEDGRIINISNSNLLVPSFNPKTSKIENKKATHLWKLNKKELIEIKADNGNDFSIKVTPEHPFFALKNGQIIQIRADKLTENDFIALPREIEINGNPIKISEKIKDLDLYIYLNKEETERIIKEKNKTIKEIHNTLKNKRNYCQLTTDIKKGKIPIELVNLDNFSSIRTKLKNAINIIQFPLFLNSELAEFLGYVMGDGHLDKNYVEIVTEDGEIIQRMVYLSKNLFGLNVSLKRDTRTKSMYKLVLSSSTLVKLISIFGLNPGKKGKKLEIPEEILKSNNEVVRSFIRAYFDCDSYASQGRNIELSSESNILIKQMNLLLNRFNIASTISKKITNNVPYWRLYIKSKSAELYADKIGYLIEKKQKRANRYRIIGINQGCGDQEMLPLGKILKEIRESLGFSIGEIQENAVFSYGRYEESGFISREHLRKLIEYYRGKKGRFFQILDSISNNEDIYEKYSREVINGLVWFLKNQEIVNKKGTKIILTNKGESYLQLVKNSNLNEILNNLEFLSESNVFWSSVKEINKITNDQDVVYDLTVEDNHSFIAEGFIVHNTTTIGKLGNYFAKRGNKVALVGLDVHRPAAAEQLKQTADKNNLTCFIEPKEKSAVKIWKKYESELEKYSLVLIDTAGRHMLDEELISEIKELDKSIKPTERILVMPADIGQAAKRQSKEFQDAVKISGVIITRMDSSAKGGGAITACNETKAGVYFITTGEKINDIEEFNPSSFLSRLLGMGDLQALIEKIKSVTDEKNQEKIKKNLEEGRISLDDVVEQVKAMGSMGGFDKIKSMIPGLRSAKIPENALESQQTKIAKWEHILKSMTKEEKENPELLKEQHSRINRIASGAGVANSEIKSLLKQYDMLNEFIKNQSDFDPEKGMNQKQMMKLAKKFGKIKKMRF
ncbi:signal recognition particle receptor subunit alpha [Candidatus Pacearchaeota archaeon]|nr:signal recognition particle receptor subunit alpha [Candidatus Pacearchaeota archaeon]